MMKARKLVLGAVAAAAVTTLVLVACNKKINEKGDHALTAGVLAVCDCANTITADSTISGNISTSLTLHANKRYKLSSLVFVTNGATLTIEKGTTIQGIKGTGTTVGGGLVVTRGSKLIAEGSASCPIVFTSDQATPASGDWAGVVLLGNAQTNNYPASVEGISSAQFQNVDLIYGSADSSMNNDNSGSLRYVRIEYAGYALSLNNEINGLTLAGVGRGTSLDHIECFRSNDDSFEFFGGCVNATHLLSIDGLDDMFDTDNGYTGSISFSLGMADPNRKDQSQSNGLENDNNATGLLTRPFTHPHYSNITIIGVDSVSAHSQKDSLGLTLRYGRGAHMRRNARFDIQNSIIFGYNYGISIDSQLRPNPDTNSYFAYSHCEDVIDHVFAAGYGTPATGAIGPWATESNGIAATGSGFFGTFNPTLCAGSTTNTGVRSSNANPFSFGSPYTRPASPVTSVSNFVPTIGQASRPYGAFPNGTSWLNADGCATDNWSRFK